MMSRNTIHRTAFQASLGPWRRPRLLGIALVLLGLCAFTAVATPSARAATSPEEPERAVEWVSQTHGELEGSSGAGPIPYLGPGNQGFYLSTTGDEVLYPSSDPFTGPAGTQDTFRGVRTPSGWTSSGTFPPEAMGTYEGFMGMATVGAAGDLNHTVLFGTARLLPADGNNTFDVYLLDAQRNLTLLSAGNTSSAAYFGGSTDMSHVVFQTQDNLVPSAVGSAPKLYEWVDGALRLVGIKPDGTVDPGGSSLVTDWNLRDAPISPDGSQIVFQSPDPSASSSADPTAVYVRLHGSSTVEASASQCARADCNAPAPANLQWVSRDGNAIFFTTTQQLVDEDTDEVADLYRYDVASGQLARLSPDVGVLTNGPLMLGTSADGTRAYFESLTGVMVWDHGHVQPIGGRSDYQPARSSPTGGCSTPNPEVTPDGAFLLLPTPSPSFLPAGAPEPGSGLWLYSLYDEHWTHVAPLSGGNLESMPGGMLGTGQGDCMENRSLSDDGSYVLFQTADRLTQDDHDTAFDVYQWHNGTTSLISTGSRNLPSMLLTISPTARDVFFETFDPLVSGDHDDVYDVYDARIGGRPFPPAAVVPPACNEDDCQGQSTVSPGFVDPASVSLSGIGNLKSVPPKKVVVVSLTRSQKLKKALRKCKSKRKKSLRKKCQASARKSFGRTN